MSDKFEMYVREHRDALDTHEPSAELWQKINAKNNPLRSIKSRLSWLKYFAYGASAIALIVVYKLSANNNSDKISNQQNSISSKTVAYVSQPQKNDVPQNVNDVSKIQTNGLSFG